MAQGPGEWVDKTACVMPTIPEELGIDPILSGLLHHAAFLELSADDTVDPDWAVEAMEHVGAYLQRLKGSRAQGIQEDLDKIADYGKRHGWHDDLVEFIDNFLRYSGVAEDRQ